MLYASGAALPSTARWLLLNASGSAGALAGPAQVTRWASAFGLAPWASTPHPSSCQSATISRSPGCASNAETPRALRLAKGREVVAGLARLRFPQAVSIGCVGAASARDGQPDRECRSGDEAEAPRQLLSLRIPAVGFGLRGLRAPRPEGLPAMARVLRRTVCSNRAERLPYSSVSGPFALA